MSVVIDVLAVIGFITTVGTLGFIGLIIAYEIEDRLNKKHEHDQQDKWN